MHRWRLSVSLSLSLQPLSSPLSPLDSFLSLRLPLHSSYSSFHLSSPVSSHLPPSYLIAHLCFRLLPTSPSYLSSPLLLSWLILSPQLPFLLLFSTHSCLVFYLFASLVFFCATWQRFPKTSWHLSHCPLILSPPHSPTLFFSLLCWLQLIRRRVPKRFQ